MAERNRSPAAPGDYHAFVDRSLRMMIGQMTGGMAPSALATAMADWSMHLGTAPGKQLMLAEKALRAQATLAARAFGGDVATPLRDDRRFASELWDAPPFSTLRRKVSADEVWGTAAPTTGRNDPHPT